MPEADVRAEQLAATLSHMSAQSPGLFQPGMPRNPSQGSPALPVTCTELPAATNVPALTGSRSQMQGWGFSLSLPGQHLKSLGVFGNS